jgi:hypothetical protein
VSHELLYTSVPRGLKPGSRGFCTVACTQGIPAPLVGVLESLSAYRHVFPPGSPNAGENPVVWSHVKLQSAGRWYRVLSRISDYGLDYSERTNKLAHHVALEARELNPGGPAWTMQQPEFMETSWEGEPRVLSAGRTPRAGDPPAAICTTWQVLTGDAGWAGVLAEAFLANPERQVYIVFEPGMDLLPLIAEAIGLLPLERRWEATFSTYFTTLPPGVICNWRCVLADSPEAAQSRRFVQALRIDLCNPLPSASGGPLVEAARTGVRPASAASAPPALPSVADEQRSDDELAEELELQPVEDVPPEAPAPAAGMVFRDYVPAPKGDGYAVGGPPPLPPGIPPPPPGKDRQKIEAMYAADARRKRRWLPVKIAAGTMLLISIVLGILQGPALVAWLEHRPADEQVAEKNTDGSSAEPHGAGAGDNGKRRSGKATPDGDGGTAVSEAGVLPGAGPDDDQRPGAIKHAPEAKEEPRPPASPPSAHVASNEEGKKQRPQDAGSGEAAPPAKPAASDREPAAAPPRPQVAPSPTYTRGPVTQVSHDPKTFTLYSLVAENGGILEIPVGDLENVKWDVHLPKEFAKKFEVSAGGPASRELRIYDAVEPRLVFQINGKRDGAALRLEMKQTETTNGSPTPDAWFAIRWCVLSVSGGTDGAQLFALQHNRPNGWQEGRLNEFKCSLAIPNTSDKVPVPRIYAKSVELRLNGKTDSFLFTPPGDTTAPTDGTVGALQSPDLVEHLRRVTHSERAASKLMRFNQNGRSLSFDLSGLALSDTDATGRGFREFVKREAKSLVDSEPIFAKAISPSDPEEFPRKVANEAFKGKIDALARPKAAVEKELEALRKDEKAAPSRIKVLESTMQQINELETAIRTLSEFGKGLGSAEIVRAEFSYDVPVPKEVTYAAVRIPLEFTNGPKK